MQAGHPHPMVIRRDGTVQLIGDGGLPIGLIPGATYQSVSTVLMPGDRLFLVSDGVTECPDQSGVELGDRWADGFGVSVDWHHAQRQAAGGAVVGFG